MARAAAPGGCAELFDAFWVHHLVGFYLDLHSVSTTCHRFFSPPGPAVANCAGGVAHVRSSAVTILALLLKTSASFWTSSLRGARAQGPAVGARRHRPGAAVPQPAGVPPRTKISGTHATEATADWWDAAGPDERRAATATPNLRAAGVEPDAASSALDAGRAPLDTVSFRIRFARITDAGRVRLACIASTRRRWSATTTGRGACRGRSRAMALDDSAVERAAFLRELSGESNRMPRCGP